MIQTPGWKTIILGGAVEVAVRLMCAPVVVGEDVVAAFEVGDGAGDFEDAVVGPGAYVHLHEKGAGPDLAWSKCILGRETLSCISGTRFSAVCQSLRRGD